MVQMASDQGLWGPADPSLSASASRPAFPPGICRYRIPVYVTARLSNLLLLRYGVVTVRCGCANL